MTFRLSIIDMPPGYERVGFGVDQLRSLITLDSDGQPVIVVPPRNGNDYWVIRNGAEITQRQFEELKQLAQELKL